MEGCEDGAATYRKKRDSLNDNTPTEDTGAPAPASEGTPDHDGPEGRPRKALGFWGRLRAYFLAGILVTAPLTITFALASWLIEFVDSRVVPLIPDRYNPDFYLKEYLGYQIGLPGLGLLVLVIVITLIGALTAGLVGRFVVRFGESMLNRMPVIRSVYGASKQILETVLQSKSNAFRQPVLVEYPRKGLWAIAFITGTTEGEVQHLVADRLINVFLPTTPNPTSGFLLFVPRNDLIILDMSVEEAIKMVISAGIVTPPDRRPKSVQKVPVTAAHDKLPKESEELAKKLIPSEE